MVGGVEATSVNVFPPDVAYTALGHLHLPQQPAENVWYAGSPIPMSFSEQDYAHRVLQIDIEAVEGGRARARTTSIPIPRSVEMQTWPSRTGAMSVAEASLRIAAQPEGVLGDDGWPLVQIRLAAGATAVDKRTLDERAVGKRVRLLHVDIERVAAQQGDATTHARLEDVSPQIVFEDAWRQAYPNEPDIPADVAAAFAEAVAAYTQVQA
jgi:exonuclease SbcD